MVTFVPTQVFIFNECFTGSQSPQQKVNDHLSTYSASLTTSEPTPFNTMFYLNTSISIPKDFDYSTKHFNLDIDELYPEHRNAVESTFWCEVCMTRIACTIDDFDAIMTRHETA
jgi:hypothetical protein